MNITNMKSSNHNSENLYIKHFHIADTNYDLFLTEELMNKLRKRNLFEGKKKMTRKMQIAQRTNTARARLDLRNSRNTK